MNIKIRLAILSTLVSSVALAEPEVSGKITHESASYTASGTTIGAASSHGKDNFKSETNARVYIDGNLEDDAGSTYHIELQGFHDGQAINGYDTNESYTQRDPLREAYIDTTHGDWAIRAGKQQTVWGTADGMKLLDAINPTDYSELAQNQMEDSRIPVWMINAEKTLEDGGAFQVIVSEPKTNYIPGLTSIDDGKVRSTTIARTGALRNTSGTSTADTPAVDRGHPFIMKGVDSISGKSNGILNIVPALGDVAQTFTILAAGFANSYNNSAYNLENWTYADVNEFMTNTGYGAGFAGACAYYGYDGTKASSACMQSIAADTNIASANLISGMGTDQTDNSNWNYTTPDTTFEYMPNATFSTFAKFAGAKTKYIRDGEQTSANAGLRYKNTTKSGVNYSFNYLRSSDPNPHIELEWQNSSGEALTVGEAIDASGYSTGRYTVTLTDSSGSTAYGILGGSNKGTFATVNPVTLVLREKNARIHNIGGSFDTTIETEQFGPVVIRGEALYQKDVMSPVVNKAKMKIGNITEAFTAHKGDKFKYVIGADITALTNMMVSLQFIQERDLDFVDETATVGSVSGNKYTAALPYMSMQNQYAKAEKNKEFVSLFLSKPYGESGQHRWNNIIIFEENGGKWNRLDTEYTLDDNTVLTAEYNKYWGNENTQFGQFKNSSNVQVGVKYSF